jgi:hypothetical protein
MKSFVLGILKDTVGLAWSINRPPCFARRSLVLYQWPEYLTHFFGIKFWQTLNQ